MRDADLHPPRVPASWGEAFAALPQESPPDGGWNAVAGRLDARRRTRAPLWLAMAAAIATMMPTAPRDAKGIVHPKVLSMCKNGTAEKNCPTKPKAPVSCCNTGVHDIGNQLGNSRITDKNAEESPTPMSTRAKMAII